MKLLWVSAMLEILGLILAIVSVVWFSRVTMLALFAIGLPAIGLGMLLYLVAVVRVMIAKGAI